MARLLHGAPVLRRLVPALVLTAACSAAWAGPAAAQAPTSKLWTEAQEVSAGQNNGEVPQVGIDDDGGAVAVWLFKDPNPDVDKTRVQFAARARDGNFVVPGPRGPNETEDEHIARVEPTYLSGTAVAAKPHIRMAMNNRGDAIVVWETANGRVRSAYRPFNGEFGDEQVVSNGGGVGPGPGVGAFEPEVGIDGQGGATVILRKGPPQDSLYVSMSRAPGGAATWEDEKRLIAHPFGFGQNEFPTDYTEINGSLSVDEEGNRSAVFASDSDPEATGPGPGTTGDQHVYEVTRNSGEADWSVQNTERSGNQVHHSTHALREQGGRLAAWTHAGELAAVASSANGGNLADGCVNCRENDPDLAGPTGSSGSAFAPGEIRLGLWSTGSLLHASNVQASPNFDPEPDPDPIDGNAGATRTRPRLDSDADDTHMAVFMEERGDQESVQIARRPPNGNTTFDGSMTVQGPNEVERSGAPVALSEPCDLNAAIDCELEKDEGGKKNTGPRVAVNSSGEAVAVWAQADGSSAQVVKTSLYVPRSNVPPPPPPRPQPAVPAVIELARPLGRGEATVLTLTPGAGRTSSAGATKVDWGFGSQDEPPVTGETVNGELERSVRLRLPERSFKASVQVDTPNGRRTFSRTFTAPSPPRTDEAREVLSGLDKVKPPPVFAIGKTEVLTAKDKACAQLKIWTGQQKQSGCFKPIEGIPDIPKPELGALDEVAKTLDVNVGETKVMEQATKLTDGYVAQGRALLNDKFPVTPGGGASIVSIPQGKALISARAQLPVGNATFDPKKGFNLELDPKKVKIPLGKLPNPPKLPSLAGLEIVGDYNVDLDKQEAKIRASVKFPEAFKKNGVRLENEVILRATPNEIIVDEVRVGPIDLNVAALKVNKFQIKYTRQGNQWDGQGKACVVGTACLDMIPDRGGVTIRDGTLSRAGATLGFPPPGLPLFTGVNLERIGFGIGLKPTRVFGSARVGVGQILKIDGRVFIAFPDAQTPYFFDQETAGTGFPKEFYGRRSTTPTFGASAEALVDVPVIGETKLGSAYALYEYPDYAAFGGGYSADILDLVSVSGGISAEADFGDGLFNIHGSVRACLHIIDDICSGATGNVSRGRNGTGGAGACVEYLGLNVGGGVQWSRLSEPFIWPIDGCKWSRFRATVREGAVNAKAASAARAKGAATLRAKAPPATRAAGMSPKAKSAATSYTVNIEKGKPAQLIQLDGVGSAPTIRVRGPGGSLELPAGEGFKLSGDKTIRAARFENKFAKFAVVGFQNAKPGTYTIETLPGSAAVSGVKQAVDPPAAKVTGKVSGKGRIKRLRYDIRPRENQKVIFQEMLRNGSTQFIGSTTKSGKGSLRFKSFPGFGRRKIVAQFELSGIPVERKRVTTFTPQSPRLKRPRRLRARHQGNKLRVSWRKVSGARTYEVAAALSSRRMVFKTTRRTKATLRVPRYLKGKVTVRAMDREFRQSRLASRRFKGKGKQPSPFRPLLNCRVLKTRIICTERNQRCGGRTPTISASKGRRTLGTRRSDVITGSSGADRIDGRGGNDIICAGGGNDRITGGAGNDVLQGEAGKDRITGGAGNDRIDGGASADRIKGGAGNDRISGGSGNDVVVGGAGRGRDTINTGSGNDRVETRDRNARDRVNCGPGRDSARVDRVDGVRGCERRNG